MCGRYATSRSAADLSALFDAVQGSAELAPSYNVAPTDTVPVVRVCRQRDARVLGAGRWGLVPQWARDPKIGAKMINARAETVATARAYAGSFATRRALVPADGWYEWRRDAAGAQAYFMTPRDGSVLAFAGIWSRWGPAGLLTFSVITTAAVGDLAAVHERMPLVLPPRRWASWLADPVGPGLLAVPSMRWLAGLEIRPVGAAVGSVRNNGPDLTTRVDISRVAETLF